MLLGIFLQHYSIGFYMHLNNERTKFQVIPIWLEITWRSNGSLHFKEVYSVWFGIDLPTFEILQISSNCVWKRHRNFVGETQVDVQKGLRQNDDNEVCFVKKTMDPNNKRSNFLFKLMGHPHLVALEHTTTIASNADQFLTKLL
jgi:hypothetical protein